VYHGLYGRCNIPRGVLIFLAVLIVLAVLDIPRGVIALAVLDIPRGI